MNISDAAREVRAAGTQAKLRRRMLPVLLAGCFGTAVANPLGPQVVNGQAGFTSQGNLLSITNTPGAIINWQSFSINPGEITRFIQQNPNSAVLNRIVGQDPSHILGALQSNGRVFLINPNGILFGQGAQVDVNGLVASTLNISNEDFLKGKLDFKAGDKAGNLKHQGAITTPSGGQVVLIAPNVENSGIITSPKGDVMLAAGHSVQLVDTLNPDLRVVVSAPEHEALNLGQIITQGGKTGIYGALVKQRGVINADSAVVGENGKVVLKASRDTLLEAGSRTSARGAGKGGEIQVLGERVGLTGDAKADASGQQGGGTVLVGGDYQGKNPEVQNAKVTYVGKDAEIKADAIDHGDGGKVIAWSDDTTRVYGSVSVKGGAQSGNGGFVETSGKQFLDVTSAPDLSAAYGKSGTWLLDPDAITISSAVGSNMTGVSPFTPSTAGTVSVLNHTVLASALASGGTVTVDTTSTLAGNGNIVVDASATDLNTLNLSTGGTLNLWAYNDISVNANIVNAGSPLEINMVANKYGTGSTGTISIGNGVQLKSKDGNISMLAKDAINLNGAGVDAGTGGAVKFLSRGSISLLNSTVDTTGGASITMIAGWDGNTATPAVGASASGGITLNASRAITNGNNILKAGTGGITTTGTGAGASGMFLQGSPVVLDAIGSITVTALDGNVIARTTGDGTGAISLSDVGALVVGNSTVSSVPAGITTTNSNITLNAAAVLSVQSGSSIDAGTGDVSLNAGGSYDAQLYGTVTGKNIALSSNGLLTVTNSVTGGSASGTVDLAAANITLGNGAAITGREIGLRAKQATTGMIATASGATVNVGTSATTGKIGLKADNVDFSQAAPTLTATQAIQYSTLSDERDIEVNANFTNASYDAPFLIIGNDTVADTNTTKNISFSSAINRGTQGLVLLAGGLVSQAAASTITAGSLGVRAGTLSASAGTVSLGEANSVATFAADAKGALTFTSGHALSVGNVTDGTNSISGIKTNNGNVTVNVNGANTNLSVAAPGIDSCYTTAAGTCATIVTLDATGSITVPLVKAGTKVILNAGTDVIDGDGSANNIVGANGSIELGYTVGGTINLDAWGATTSSGSTATTNQIRFVQPPSSSGGTSAPPPPTVDQCTANPSLSGCSTVLPSLSTCTTAPTTAGCSAVLPTVDACTADPTKAGCTAVLPTVDACTVDPTKVGCSAVLPTLSTCTAAPTTAGCSAVLPTVDACTSDPGKTGCTAVLPTLSTCTTAPATAGCSVVLPSLPACVADPGKAGCTAVLPTVDACTSNPVQTGCATVLPKLDTCISTPTTAGCSVVLPTMSSCTSDPTQAGCTAVLPTLAQCSATPTLAGCSVVVPAASKCVTSPAAPECRTVLPTTETTKTTTTITEKVTETTNTVVSTSVQASTTKVQAGSGSSSGGASGRPAEQSSESKGDDKKDDKKTTSKADDSGAKNEKPATKMYCN